MDTVIEVALLVLRVAAMVVPWLIGCAFIAAYVAIQIRATWRKLRVIRRVIRGEIDKGLNR
jgi:hypothetical protein